jgi:hypothetical protein
MIGDKKSMTKKKYLELQKKYRVTNGFNTGTRDMKSEKYPSRQKQKREVEKWEQM